MSVTELLFPTSPLDVCYGFLKTLEQLVDLHCDKAKKKKYEDQRKKTSLNSISSGIQHEAGMTGSHPATKARVK